ncbi:MAG: hypothetical protein J1F66_01475 [Clostridiales bacterium]|nr:hypothetical protein [Clostridiales bacterium]
MKKLIVIALVVVMALSIVAFAACGGSETVTGEYSYENYGHTYGAKVDVTVKNGVITKVKLYTDEEAGGWVRTTKSENDWAKGKPGDADYALGYEKTEAAYADWLVKAFEGKTVEEVKAYETAMDLAKYTQSVSPADVNLAGATQSAVRIIRAVQNALEKLGK